MDIIEAYNCGISSCLLGNKITVGSAPRHLSHCSRELLHAVVVYEKLIESFCLSRGVGVGQSRGKLSLVNNVDLARVEIDCQLRGESLRTNTRNRIGRDMKRIFLSPFKIEVGDKLIGLALQYPGIVHFLPVECDFGERVNGDIMVICHDYIYHLRAHFLTIGNRSRFHFYFKGAVSLQSGLWSWSQAIKPEAISRAEKMYAYLFIFM